MIGREIITVKNHLLYRQNYTRWDILVHKEPQSKARVVYGHKFLSTVVYVLYSPLCLVHVVISKHTW